MEQNLIVPSTPRFSAADIEAAASKIDPVFSSTPQFRSEPLEAELGVRTVLKVETINPIRSFKGRGADLLLQSLEPGQRLYCASSGNFGQGMAYAGRKHGCEIIVYTSTGVNPVKLERMRSLGAEVRLVGDDFDDAKLEGVEEARRQGCRFVEDGRDIEITIGAGTIGYELGRWPEPIDAVLVPLGNGALINGIGCWIKSVSPSTMIIGVSATAATAMEQSWRSRTVVNHPDAPTIADGIAIRLPVPEAVEDMMHWVDDVVLVDDSDLIEWVKRAFWTQKIVLEPSGAVGLAAASRYRDRFSGKTIATILCGGNLAAGDAQRWLVG